MNLAATPADVLRLDARHAEAYRRLMLDAYGRDADAFTSTVQERESLPLEWWIARLSRHAEQHAVFGAFRDGTLVGAAGIAFETREKSRHKANVFGMYVRDDSRRLGLAQRLVAALLEHATRRSDTLVVQLTVSEGNGAAEALYAACGFAVFGVEPMAVRSGGRLIGKVHMWREVPRA